MSTILLARYYTLVGKLPEMKNYQMCSYTTQTKLHSHKISCISFLRQIVENGKVNWHAVSNIIPEINKIVELKKWLIMKQETLKQKQASQLLKKDQNQQKDEKNKVVPQTGNLPNATNSGGSMSEGNLSNSRYSRERTRLLRDKQFIMGSDSDGQAN